jgi:alpha-tubulin suppressor-like RCC1 family protein
VRDARGARVRGIRIPVTLAPNGPTHPPLFGAATVTSVDGVAVFPGLYHRLAGAGYSLVANGAGLNTGISDEYAVTPGPAARVTASAPAQVIVDSGFTLTVRAFDAYDNELVGLGVDALELSVNPWREARVFVSGGLEGVSIDRPGDGYRIRARVGAASGESGLVSVRLNFTSVSAGTYRACGLSYGRAYCWGVRLNGGPSGQIESDSVPRAAAPALRFADIVSGTLFTCGRQSAGAVYCWGLNPDGAPGDTARLVPGGLAFNEITAGPEHVCGVTDAGAVYCWGSNRDGQLGDNSLTDRPAPVLAAASGFSQVSAGERHTCALRTDGTVACWGNNLTGQLGTGNTQAQRVPSDAAVGFTFAQISAGYWHTCGRTADRHVYCWGQNTYGQLGDSTLTNSPVPVEAGFGFFTDLSAGGGHTCALDNALVYCWGANITGQLGDGGLNGVEPYPVLTLLLTSWPKSSLASGGLFTCVRAEFTGVHCWGANRFGEVGNGSTTAVFVPVRVIQ